MSHFHARVLRTASLLVVCYTMANDLTEIGGALPMAQPYITEDEFNERVKDFSGFIKTSTSLLRIDLRQEIRESEQRLEVKIAESEQRMMSRFETLQAEVIQLHDDVAQLHDDVAQLHDDVCSAA